MRRRLPALASAVALALSLFPSVPTQAQAASCSLPNAAFCETFDHPGSGGRGGQLDSTLWGVSRWSGDQNFSNPVAGWGIANGLTMCGHSGPSQPDNDIFLCNGQLVEGYNDHESVTSLAMYPKQPFDFAGRTGKVVFDVSDDSQGTHAAWPELWVTDRPGPVPFTHEGGGSVPRNGFGVRFAGAGGGCVGVDSADAVASYVENDSFMGQGLDVQTLGCVRQPTAPGQLNHFELDVSQAAIEVYGTDAGTTAPLKHIASIPNANLNFTRGLVWIEDAHYNANKFNSQGTHAFTWDNVGFDGPVLPRDLTYDVPDNLTPANDGTLNLGWNVDGHASKTFTLTGVADPATSTGQALMFDMWAEDNGPYAIAYSVNGHSHSFAWAWPTTTGFDTHQVVIPLAAGDVQAGTNTVVITPPVMTNLWNVGVLLIGAGGGGSQATPTPTNTPVSTDTPTPTATPLPTNTPLPTDTPVPPTDTPVPSTPTPSPTPGQQYSQNLNLGDSVQVTCSAGTLAVVTQSQSSEVLTCQ